MGYTLITGASSGIGKSLAYKFASEGHDIIITARRKSVLDDMQKDIKDKHGKDVVVIESDLSKKENAHGLYEQVRGMDLEVLINNAGFGDANFLWDADIADATRMIDLNVRSLSVLSMLFTRDHMDKDAQLINVASVGGYMTMPSSATYIATKFYVTAYTESLALDLQVNGKKMKAKVLAPGPVETEFLEVANKNSKNKFDASMIPKWHSSDEMAGFTYELYKADSVVGFVSMKDMSFQTRDAIHPGFGSL